MSYIFRAYHARTGGFTSPKGMPTQAVYLFTNMLRKLLREHEPDYVAVVFESAGPTVRDKLFKEYKAQRPPMPDDLAVQLPYIRQLCEGMRLPMLELEGYEADDVIGTLARRAAAWGIEAVVVSSDKDLLQLVQTQDSSASRGASAPIWVFSPTREIFYDEDKVQEYYGVPPEQVVDVVALMGDAIDNIPGAKGIGEKGARELIVTYGSVEKAMEQAAQVKKKTYREALQKQQEQIRLSKHLATLHTELPVELDLERLTWRGDDPQKLSELFAELGFTSLLKEYLPAGGRKPDATDYSEFKDPEELRAFVAQERAQPLAVWCEAEGEWSIELTLTATAFSPEAGQARVARLDARRKAWLQAAAEFLEDTEKPKAVHNAKAMALALGAAGVELRGVADDTALYSYLLLPTTAKHDLEECAVRQLNQPLSGAVAEKADFIRRLASPLRNEVEAADLLEVYETIERPLSPVLARMERAGIRIDRATLTTMSEGFEKDIEKLKEEVYRLAGTEFNLNSPKQLGEVLFEKLQLPMPRKYGKGKAPSTAADVLEELSAAHELPRRVLDYRELAKLKSTYVDTLPTKIHPRTGRLHTSFHQTGTATGRLSSSDPNLQNIPIRGELGNRIREAFIAEPGWVLIGGDYSQIELRVLAHMSNDPVLVEAFRQEQDIHERTAQEVLGVSPGEQTGEHRRIAKMINYGIVYGLTPYGLATRLGIDAGEAKRYIGAYFERYAGVRKYREELLDEVRRTGYARTLFGRRRPIPEIEARNPTQRNFAERTALNSPLQGTAADLLKLAMINADERLRQEEMRTRMILTVHDELLFEAPQDEVGVATKLIRKAMEEVELSGGAQFRVPLVVELGAGPNWAQLK